MNILAIGAHPDDIELGCSATLLRHKKQGNNVYLLILSKGEASGDPKIREMECRESAKLMCVDGIFFGDLEDTKIDDGVKTIITIEKIINEIKPDIIYTHSYKDTHQDHRNTSYATLSAGRRIKKIFMYESPTTLMDFSPHVFVDISDEFEKKRQIMRLFPSQSDKEWYAKDRAKMAPMALEGLATYRGFQSRVKVAEAFEVGKLVINKNDNVTYNI
ncbi:MAG: PIG-L deacetylase family protein [Candidatus Hodarchaeota archaeon]